MKPLASLATPATAAPLTPPPTATATTAPTHHQDGNAVQLRGNLVARILPSSPPTVPDDYELTKRTTLPLLPRSHPIYSDPHHLEVVSAAGTATTASKSHASITSPSYFWMWHDESSSSSSSSSPSYGTVTWDIDNVVQTTTLSSSSDASLLPSSSDRIDNNNDNTITTEPIISPGFALHMNRDGSEMIDKAIQRLALTIQKKIMPKQSKKKQKGKRNAAAAAAVAAVPPLEYALYHHHHHHHNDDNGTHIATKDRVHADLWNELLQLSNDAMYRLDMTMPNHRQATDETKAAENHHETTNAISSHKFQFDLKLNPPTLVRISTFVSFQQKLYVGVPIVVRVQSLFATTLKLNWYLTDNDKNKQFHHLDNNVNEFAYTPSHDDIGKSVIVVVTLGRSSSSSKQQSWTEAFQFRNIVEACPPNALLNLRKDFIANRDRRRHDDSDNQRDESIRVVTYNILADTNAFSPMAQEWFYPYIDDTSIIEKERRFPHIVDELLQYDADILCLQEVDQFVYANLLKPVLTICNYQGYFSNKHGSSEGVAIFWSLDAFEAIEEDGIMDMDDVPDTADDHTSSPPPPITRSTSKMKTHLIRDIFQQPNENTPTKQWKSMNDIHKLLNQVPELKHVLLEKLSHVLQTIQLTCRRQPRRKILVGNTHLFYHSKADHIRLLQTYACLYQMDQERNDKNTTMIFCGDLNSSPNSGAARLIFQRCVEPSSSASEELLNPNDEQAKYRWKNLYQFTWDGADSSFENVPESERPVPPTIELPDTFPILRSGCIEMPQYTHYLQNFKATLDYVLVSESSGESGGLAPHRSAEMPDEELLSKDVAMPSAVFPSDHVSLICDLKWKKQT